MTHRNNGGSERFFTGSDPVESADVGDFLEAAVTEGKAYYTAQKEYLTLYSYQKVGKAAGGMFSGLLSAVAFLMFLLFGSVALAIWLGSLMNSLMLGFLAVGGLYLLSFVIVHFLARDAIRGSFMLNVINSFYDDED